MRTVIAMEFELEFKTKNDKQIEGVEAWISDLIEQMLYGGAKSGGKSFLGATLIFSDALTYDGTHYFIARRRLIDLRLHTIPTIHEVFQKVFNLPFDKYCKYNAQDHIFTLKNGSTVLLIACDDVPSDPLFERFGSMQMTRGWIEEAGEVPEGAKANLWLSVGRWKNEEYGLPKKLLITANPKKGWLKRDFVDPWKEGTLSPKLAFIPALPTDNKYNSEGYIESLRDEKDPVRRQRLYEGNWDYDDDKDSLISEDALSDTFTNTIDGGGGPHLIVDVARKGRDTTVMGLFDGLDLYKIFVFAHQTTEVTEQKIKDIAAANRIPYSKILVDEDGVGGGVVDHLKGIRGFTANSTPIPTASVIRERMKKVNHELVPKTRFGNLKAQCGWKLAELINEHKMAISGDAVKYRDKIIEEVVALLRDKEVDGDGRKHLVPKDKVKEEIGRSPDIGDMLIMRMWFELVKVMKEGEGFNEEKQEKAMEERKIILSRNRKNRTQNSTE